MQVGSEADRPTMSNNRKLLVYIMMKAPCLTFDMMIKIARAVYDFHVHLSLYTFNHVQFTRIPMVHEYLQCNERPLVLV